ncbi:unnamed protein product [Allacma fusca]|uniref:Ninjurin-2 n=1 Tax=Allacma fusca TaxID=39272 RepID=A0A8J2KGD6_9HEXA|nr:unnamed protein product [Allacma fusca]
MTEVEPYEQPQKSLNVNRYATKKTIAQGMLDIALLTANASQLKYVLQTGGHHPFYTLMLTLISLSIALQVVSGIIALTLNAVQDCRLHILSNATFLIVINQIQLYCSFIVTGINILISAFDPTFVFPASEV